MVHKQPLYKVKHGFPQVKIERDLANNGKRPNVIIRQNKGLHTQDNWETAKNVKRKTPLVQGLMRYRRLGETSLMKPKVSVLQQTQNISQVSHKDEPKQ